MAGKEHGNERLGEATDAAEDASVAIRRFLEFHEVREAAQPSTAHEQRMDEAARAAEIAAELAAMNIRRFLDLQAEQLASLIMRAAAERAKESQ